MRGFTLLEMLVALAIAGIVASTLVVAAWPSPGARAEEEARRLAALIELADAEARADGRAIAWSPEPGGYAFWQRGEDGEWSRFPPSSIYQPRALGEPVVVRGERIVLGVHGLAWPSQASVSAANTHVVLRREALGRISLQRLHAR
jgi:general secretion pathway protein H